MHKLFDYQIIILVHRFCVFFHISALVVDLIDTILYYLSHILQRIGENMQHSDNIAELVKALISAEAEYSTITKNCTAQAGQIKFKYADLTELYNATKPALRAHGLKCVAAFEPMDSDQVRITTTLFHTSGQWIKSTMTLRPQGARPTDFGSVITYMRRYAYVALLGISADEEIECDALNQSVCARPQSDLVARENRTSVEEPLVKKEQADYISKLASQANVSSSDLFAHLGINSMDAMKQSDFAKAMAYIKSKAQK